MLTLRSAKRLLRQDPISIQRRAGNRFLTAF